MVDVEDLKEKELTNPWSTENKPSKKYLKLGIYGKPGSGKTRFGFTAPEPIYFIDTELGVDPLIPLFPEKNVKVIRLFAISDKENPGLIERDDVSCFEKYKAAIDYLYKNPEEVRGGTIIIDSATDIWEICQSYVKIKHFKIKTEDRLRAQWDWGLINSVYNQSVVKLLFMPCNVIFTARPKEVFIGPTATGEYVAKWKSGMEHVVDCVLNVYGRRGKDGPVYGAILDKCRMAGTLLGKDVEGIDFNILKSMMIEEMKKVRESKNVK